MLKRIAVGASACVLVALANPAMASGPGQVDVGANTGPSTHNWSAVANPLPSPSIYDIEFTVWNLTHTSNVKMGCEDATADGTVDAGAVPATGAIAQITATDWGTAANPCDGPTFIDMNVAQRGNWDIIINPTPKPTNGVDTNLSGYIDNISARVTSKIPGLCEFDVTGTAAVTFNEATQEMTVNETGGNLVTSNVTGCLGSVAANYTADFIGTYPVNSVDGAINVKP